MTFIPPELLEDVRRLLHAGQPPRRTVTVSPEVAEWLARPAPKAPPAPALDQPVSVAAPTPTPAAPFSGAPAVEAGTREAALAEIAAEVAACRKCGLCETRHKTVFADGSAHAELVFVGEAPGADEDFAGVPFVGAAGQLLTKMIEGGMGVPRASVYICNVIKCRPPQNRDPAPDEVLFCEPYLQRQLAIVQPRAIVALGGTAAKTLLRTTEGVGRLRGRWHRYAGIPLRVTYHPSYLLREPKDKGKAWDDLKAVMAQLGWPAVDPKKG